ncbi:MAG TPA: BrnT family toxin [Rhizomicrobium sp.]|nr:BrnT family toxin [Rhizomicrobium sp.]
MELEWDEAKRRDNLAKHDLDFTDVPKLDWDNATVLEDRRFPYPEPRFWAFARWRGRLHMVAFCLRGNKVRIISFRKANAKEVKRYGG